MQYISQLDLFLESETSGESQLERIQNGERTLSTLVTIAIRETDLAAFVLRSNVQLTWATLTIQDMDIGEGTESQTAVGFEYRWRPPQSDYSGFFRNHFGRSRISIRTRVKNADNVVDTEPSFHTDIEVLATKLNAHRASEMLTYLETRMADITRSCFSATGRDADSKEGSEQIAPVLLQEIRNRAEMLHVNLRRFSAHPRSRVVPKAMITSPSAATNITERSIGWVFDHLDSLVPSQAPSASSIRINSRWFDTENMTSDILEEDTDVYENQIILGYLESMVSAAAEIEQKTKSLIKSLDTDDLAIQVPPGYESLTAIRRKFGMSYYMRVQLECKALQAGVGECIRFFQKHLPVSRSLRHIPDMTPGFLGHAHYREIFEDIVAWYRLGKLTMTGERFLYGLRTLNKLYEFFCLYQIIEAMGALGFVHVAGTQPANRPGALAWYEMPAATYEFSCPGDITVSLEYEKQIKAVSRGIEFLLDSYHQGGAYGMWIPDFLIVVRHGTRLAYAVMDAKYTSPNTARVVRLPELVMKYVHGISNSDGGWPPVKSLHVLHPQWASGSDRDHSWSFHNRSFGLYSQRPTFPILGTVEVTPGPGTPGHSSSELTRVIGRIIQVLSQLD